MKCKDSILGANINLSAENLDIPVMSDSKWLEFILCQIINNSIKYKKGSREDYIKIWGEEDEKEVRLYVQDNGIGIPARDLPKVYEKSFTGQNGRRRARSTGMGLFIAKSLCEKLGHSISIDSVQGQYTKVCITFAKNSFYTGVL